MTLHSDSSAKAAIHKRKRKAHTKSRKGCDNCKLRHEKCDEGKPSCRKCRVFGVSCSYGHRATVGEAVLQPSLDGSFHTDILPALSVKQTVLGIVNASLAQEPVSNGQSRPLELTSQDLDVLSRFHSRTVPTLSTVNCVKIYQREAVRLACLHPFLMHITMSLTMMHDRHLLHSPPPPPSKAELFHLYSGTALFSKTLSGPLTSSKRDAIWAAAVFLGAGTLASIEAQTPEQAWPLRKPCENDLDWLRMYDGKRALWNIADLYRPDSCLRSMVEEAAFIHDMAAPDPMLKKLPRELSKLLGLCGDTNTPTNPFYIPANILNNLMTMESNQSTVLCFYSFVSLMPVEFKILVQDKDPYALTLIAYWFALFSQYRAWYMWRRFTLECQAICIYLERYHSKLTHLDAILDIPRRLSGLVHTEIS